MYLSILWHHHQPIYRQPESRHYLLPYVNYHLTKNYYPMACLAEETGFPCLFNLEPCLLEQIEDYTQGLAEDSFQRALEKEPEKLTSEEINQLRRFLPAEAAGKNLSRQELQLAVLHSLFPPLLEPETQASEDKDWLLWKQRETQKKVIPLYKKLSLAGQVELTTSAYYHPLLPLIVDLSVNSEPLKPALPFRYPEDAAAQVKKGRTFFKSIFALDPAGFWPPEGGISQEVAEIIAKADFSYTISDENILWKSLKRAPEWRLLGQAYACHNLTVFFRDRELSDLISFEYQRWETKEAVDHLEAKLIQRRKMIEDQGIIVIALDGENPWAGYRHNGVPFLRELYSRLKKKDWLTPILLRDYLKLQPAASEIELVPGTWLGNFSRWVGHPAKNAAWEKLASVRQKCGQSEAIFIAEGSDWFWWFGEPGLVEFESLFASYLREAEKSAPEGPKVV